MLDTNFFALSLCGSMVCQNPCVFFSTFFFYSEILADEGEKRGERARGMEGGREREGRGIQSGRACSADWYQWRQIELAGDR